MHSRAHQSELSLVRIGARGRAISVVARKTMRSGTFKARVPRPEAKRYALRLRIADRAFASDFRTPTRQEYCRSVSSRRATAEIVLGATSVLAGAEIPFTLTNTGRRCLWVAAPYRLEQQGLDGSWSDFPLTTKVVGPDGAVSEVPYAFIGSRGLLMPEGFAGPNGLLSAPTLARIPAHAPAGRYRLVPEVGPDPHDESWRPVVSPTFEVTGPG